MPPVSRPPIVSTPVPPTDPPKPGMTEEELEAALEQTRLDRLRERDELEAAQAAAAAAAELTGDALHERARELDIDGRSTMTADELREAIADAEGAPDAPAEPDPYVPPEPAPLEITTDEYADLLAQRKDRLEKNAVSTPEDAAQAQAEADAASFGG